MKNKDVQVWKEMWKRGVYCGDVLRETNSMAGLFLLTTTFMCNLKYWIDIGNYHFLYLSQVCKFTWLVSKIHVVIYGEAMVISLISTSIACIDAI